MDLLDIYTLGTAHKLLYESLAERKVIESISHRRFPTWREHCDYINSKPHKAWYFILDTVDGGSDTLVGDIYLSKRDEIGIHIAQQYHLSGYGSRAVKMLIEKHADVSVFFANISPYNEGSLKFFDKLGFNNFQITKEFRR